MATMAPNPAELRSILGQNLRCLTKDSPNISELCRRIGVNRTQFNRYLNGTAFPRPDVLFRICAHFQTDANILLQPIEKKKKQEKAADDVSAMPQRPFDHYLLPDGMYVYWRKSFRRPELVYQGMALIRTVGDEKRWKGYDIHDQPMRSGTRRHARSARYQGRLIQQFDGFTLLSRTPYNDLMNMTYFEYGLDSMPEYYSGITFITRRRVPEMNRLSAIVMRRLESECRSWLDCARTCGSREADAIPPVIQKALARIPNAL